MGTLVAVNTYSHSVTYVTDQLLRSLRFIITNIGLNPDKFVGDWKTYELGIQTWLASRHLETIVLEVISPAGALVTRVDFDIDYTYGNGEGSMWVDTDALKHSISKFGTVPALCTYAVTVSNAAGRADVTGWQSTTFLSTDGFIKQGLGTTIGTHAIGAQASYYRKS